ncbi:hypothetical protein FACS1894211_01540 [Clostridia bacterium]|nr:hypothetical protein FACS1894211_01540 [Clostridia bacterium]
MKKKSLIVVASVMLITLLSVALVACGDKNDAYEISYDYNDGSGTVYRQSLSKGTDIMSVAPIVPYKNAAGVYKAVVYWSETADGSAGAFGGKASKDMQLFAIWRVAIVFVNSEMMQILTAVTADAGTEVDLPYYHKDGYDFGGWRSGEDILMRVSMPQNGMLLLVELTPKIYKVRYESEGGIMPNGYVAEYVTGVGVSRSAMPAPLNIGKLFLGWFTAANASGVRYAEINGECFGDLTLYAGWYDNAQKTIDAPFSRTAQELKTGSMSYGMASAHRINIPNELKSVQSLLRVQIEITTAGRMRNRSNKEESVLICSVYFDGVKTSLWTLTAVGKDWPWNSVDPHFGDWVEASKEYSSTVSVNGDAVNVGYIFSFSQHEVTNWAGGSNAADINMSIASIKYSFLLSE